MSLGKLESIDVRNYWKNEDDDFTPWLAQEENIQLLAESLGIDIEVEGVEKFIGSYRVDIVARDSDNRIIIIENQLEKTDHKHLGQLITYASGINAHVLIWICTEITDEHRKAVDWLNENTREEIAFFACEIELWKIGSSVPAPRFNVISSPNEWSKIVKSAPLLESLSPTKESHLQFWNAFKEYMTEQGSDLRLRTPRARPWYSLSVGKSKFNLALTTNTQSNKVGCELYIRGKYAKVAFSQLRLQKQQIEAMIGLLDWQELPEGQDCRIIKYRNGNSKDKAQWQELQSWLKEQAEVFYKCFAPRIKALKLEDNNFQDILQTT